MMTLGSFCKYNRFDDKIDKHLSLKDKILKSEMINYKLDGL